VSSLPATPKSPDTRVVRALLVFEENEQVRHSVSADAACLRAMELGASTVLLVPIDVPTVMPADFSQLAASARPAGLVCANAGVDESNVEGDDFATVLPSDPDASARRLRASLECGAVIITDTFGRPWREGLVDVAIGVAGLDPLDDHRGRKDRYGRKLASTIIAAADQLAAAAGLLMLKAAGCPVALIRGFRRQAAEGSAGLLLGRPEQDLFR
jgi:coenzyme F420-0:L-glutamate ligase